MDINELHEKFQEYGANAKEWKRKCLMLLPEIEKRVVWKKKGFNSIYEYGAKLAGLSKDSVNEALRVLKRISDKPILLKLAEKKGLQIVRPIATISTIEDQKFWAEKANSMSKHVLETYVKDYRLQILPGEAAQSVKGNHDLDELKESDSQTYADEEVLLTMNLKAETVTRLKKLNTENWNELMEKFIDLYEKDLQMKLEKNKPAIKKSTIGQKVSRHIPASIKDYVLNRSNKKCEFPNCYRNYNHLHHTNRFASDKTHDPDQIVALCKAHHDLAHKGLIHEEGEPTSWKIREKVDYTNLNQFVDEKVQFYQRK